MFSKGSSFQSLGAATDPAAYRGSDPWNILDLDRWNEMSVPLAIAEACFEYYTDRPLVRA